jgi:6-pyruvoyl-tetrahydropterin synthase
LEIVFVSFNEKDDLDGKKKIRIVAPPPDAAEKAGINGGSADLSDDFWDFDEAAVLGPFVGHYYLLSIDTFFNASHTLIIKGKKGAQHTHSYRLNVRCRSGSLSGQDQIIVDYSTLRERINRVARAYNNQDLNDLPPFKKLRSTTENLTAVLFQQIKRALKGLPVELQSITVWESPTVAVTLTRDDVQG